MQPFQPDKGFLRLDEPFYLPAALAKFVEPVISLNGTTILLEALQDLKVCEALNQALKASLELAR